MRGLLVCLALASPALADDVKVVSPDGKWIAFVREDKSRPVDPAKEIPYKDVYIVPSSGGVPRLLVSRGTPCGKNRYLGNFHSLAFLSDSRRLVFQSQWAAVHGSTHVVDVTTRDCKLVAAGNRVIVVDRGPYRDHLLVSLHKYFLTTGTYDWWWLIDADGNEIGPVAEDRDEESTNELDEFREMYMESKGGPK